MAKGLLNEQEILSRLSDPVESRRIVVTPIIAPREQFQPSSIDLRLGTEFLSIKSARLRYMNLVEEEGEARLGLSDYTEFTKIPTMGEFVLHPGDFALGCTLEYIRLPIDIAGRLEGKSTWGRMGLQVHSTAGFVDPGFAGALTFELQNVGRVAIPLLPGLLVAQLCFFATEPSAIPYGTKLASHYGGWPGLQGSHYYKRPDIRALRVMRKDQEKGDG